MKGKREIKVDQIRIDGGTQVRENISQETVYKYKEDMEKGDIFPLMEVVYDGTTYWLIDGFHRYHAMKLLNQKTVEVNYRPGTLQEAQVLALGMNAKHGLPRTNADKRRAVERALELELTRNLSDAEIARICDVSKPFVASVRNPEKKAKQEEQRIKHIQKKAAELSGGNQITGNQITTEPDPHAGAEPDEAEIKATEMAFQADMETLYKILESDDALATAHEEIKRLNHLNAQLEIRIKSLMTEKNEAIKEVKKLQKQLDKMKEK